MNTTKNSGIARVFFALWPEVSVRRTLHTLAKKYHSQCGARVMDADSLHMTLLFLGEVKRTRLLQLMQVADKISVQPFEIVLERLSFWQHNRIAYAAPQVEVPVLHQLVKALQQETLAAGFMFENHEFTPHVTLLRRVEHNLESQTITPIIWRADSFVLVESVQADQGAHYHVLQKWPLSNFGLTFPAEPPAL